jgi:hypothetical protein
VTGARPRGIYIGRSSINTIRLAAEEGGFLYSADAYADDLPYWVDGPRGPFLIVPYTLDANDMRFATPPGFNSGDQFFAYLKDAFDCLYAEGEAGAPKMMSVGLHAASSGGLTRAVARALPRLCRGTASGCRGGIDTPSIGTPGTSREGQPTAGTEPAGGRSPAGVECRRPPARARPAVAAWRARRRAADGLHGGKQTAGLERVAHRVARRGAPRRRARRGQG